MKHYTIKEICKDLQISRQKVYSLIGSWKLKAINVSNWKDRKNYRISQVALDNFTKPLEK